jgi:hypothetical protein
MKRALILMFAVAFLLVAHHSTAQHRGKYPRHAKHPEMRKELKAYTRDNVMPTMREQRLKLDAFLTKEEKKTIEDIREQFKADKKAMHAKRAQFKQQKENGTFDHEKAKAEMKPLREKHKANVEKLQAIAQKYESQMKTLREEINPKVETWKTDMEKIATKYVSEEELKMVKHHAGKAWRMRGVAFLLLPTEKPAKQERKNEDVTNVYPNPAQEKQQISVKMKEAGTLRIELYDRKGDKLQTIFEGNKPEGEHTFDVNTSTLPTGNYTYQITSPAGKTTKKLIVKK